MGLHDERALHLLTRNHHLGTLLAITSKVTFLVTAVTRRTALLVGTIAGNMTGLLARVARLPGRFLLAAIFRYVTHLVAVVAPLVRPESTAVEALAWSRCTGAVTLQMARPSAVVALLLRTTALLGHVAILTAPVAVDLAAA